MYAYVFGQHGTELAGAKEMVGVGEKGDRIRAVAQVTIGDFGSVVGIEAPDMDALNRHMESLAATGYSQNYSVMLCTLPDCTVGALPGGVVPVYLHAFPVMAFVFLELTGLPDQWPEMRSPGVAAGIEAGKRRVLLELGADDFETIQLDLAAVGDLAEVRTVRASYVRGSDLRTALAEPAEGA